MKTDRLVWLDATKGIGLILVILGHNLGFIDQAPFWHGFIYSFHMPLFFFLGGCTLSTESARNTLRRAAVHGYSYLLMATLIMPIAIILTGYNHPISLFEGILYGTGHTIDVAPLWFLSCLAIALLYAAAFILFIKAISKAPPSEITVLFGGISFIALGYYTLQILSEVCVGRPGWGSPHQSGMPWNAEVALTATGYLLIGKYCVDLCRELSSRPRNLLALIFSVSLFLLYCAYSAGMIHYDLNYRHISPTLLSAYIPLLGIISSIALGSLLAKTGSLGTVLAKIGQSGLFVLWLHSGIQNKAIKLVFDKLHISNQPILWVVSFFAAVSIPVLIDVFVIKKSHLLGRIFYPRFNFGVFKSHQKNFT